MSIEPYWMQRLQAAEVALHQELAGEVTHPVAEYASGSPRLERLYQQMDEAKRFQQPDNFHFNF